MSSNNNIMQWFNKGNSPITPPLEAPPVEVRRGPHERVSGNGGSQQRTSVGNSREIPREVAAGPTPPPPRVRGATPPAASEWGSKTTTIPKHTAEEGRAPDSSKAYMPTPPSQQPSTPLTPSLTLPKQSLSWVLTPSDIISLSDKARRGLIGGPDIVQRHLCSVYGVVVEGCTPTTATTPFSGSTFDRSEPEPTKLKAPPSEWTRKQ
eukprot:PhF_6_TR5366/c0_g1_i1/m.7704